MTKYKQLTLDQRYIINGFNQEGFTQRYIDPSRKGITLTLGAHGVHFKSFIYHVNTLAVLKTENVCHPPQSFGRLALSAIFHFRGANPMLWHRT